MGSVTISSLLRMLYSRAGSYPARQPMLYAEDFLAQHAAGRLPAPPRPGPRVRGDRATHGAGRFAVDPRARDRLLAAGLARAEPARHPGHPGRDVDKPWRDLPRKDRDWILYTDETPTVPVYAGFTPKETKAALRSKMEPSYMGTFTGRATMCSTLSPP